jgi:hypothetical protein
VTYPDDVPAHTKVQQLYFGDDLMLRRLDYVTDVLGGVATHYCFDHVTIEGLVFPTLRRIVRRTPAAPSCLGVRLSFSTTPTWWSANDLEHRQGFNPRAPREKPYEYLDTNQQPDHQNRREQQGARP